ncbi:MAG: group II intron reverse transcriptase/maturase [Xenococcus sp. (in: cyanobacteria)]
MSNTDSKIHLNTVEWNQLNWRKIQKVVWKLQKRIYRAYVSGDVRKGRRLQKTLINSYYNRLLSVRKVTQDNSGKKTAGVDKVKSLTPKQRFELARNLKLGDKSKPIRRVWIPKSGKKEKRPLGIPVMRDRAAQALAKSALEPEWEAKFEGNSHGFRPGRSAHDAIEAIFLQIRYIPKYVLDADISKCFDRINHQKLLAKINTYPKLRRQLKTWLKAEIIDYVKHERTPNSQGTPQGGVISPLLSNIALHGMENRIKQFKGREKPALIRYADDFVIMHSDIEKIKQCQKIISDWLSEYGLKLNTEKTQIKHTLQSIDENGHLITDKKAKQKNKPGFNFLGFNIRQYEVGKHQSGTNRYGKVLGFKTIIKPSDESVKRHYQKISETVKRLNASPQHKLISELNSIIKGWCNYFKAVCSKETFSKLTRLTYIRIRRWADRRHPNKSKTWVSQKYFKAVEEDNWVFKSTGKYENALFKHAKSPISRHIKVKGEATPYDGNNLYWGKRMSKHPETKKSTARLLKKQDGKCNWCGLPFQEGDKLENDHIQPVKAGGSNQLDNRQLLHKHCHDIKTKSDLKVIKQHKAQKEWKKILRQFNYLDWEWDEDIPTLVSGTHKEPINREAH